MVRASSSSECFAPARETVTMAEQRSKELRAVDDSSPSRLVRDPANPRTSKSSRSV